MTCFSAALTKQQKLHQPQQEMACPQAQPRRSFTGNCETYTVQRSWLPTICVQLNILYDKQKTKCSSILLPKFLFPNEIFSLRWEKQNAYKQLR